jgi:NAD(P)-dependent dehydrogenase (short-subunit alcohol dehydrogenase family)
MMVEGAAVLVTGGFRGFGRALTDEFLERGAATVYATSRTVQDAFDDRVVPLVLDVADDASVTATARAAADVSILVNNAGVFLDTPVLTAPLDRIRAEFETNTLGTIRMAREFAPVLARHPRSAMLNVLSVLSWLAIGRGYEMSKAAAWSATNSLRDALREQGTVVTALHVAYMDTDMTAHLDVDKADPRSIARHAVDALVLGAPEVLADDTTRWVKSQLCLEPAS